MKKIQTILLTGGAGYIGSHTAVVLLVAGYEVVIVDSLVNAHITAIDHIEAISRKTLAFYPVDVRDKQALTQVFKTHQIDLVIHFAGLKAVEQSSKKPLDYFEYNITGTIGLTQVMQAFNCYYLVFSSSATVYGQVGQNPIVEDFPTRATNPYGLSKLVNEQLLKELTRCKKQWYIGILRYFNPVGAHSSGLLGENRNNVPNNLMPYITRVAAGLSAKLSVFGDDYNTPDGTGIRDYIHVMDLASGHLRALEALCEHQQNYFIVNLGTGRGYSVLEVIKTFEKATGQKVPYKIVPRRRGDVSACYADVRLAKYFLSWEARETLETACLDMWAWQIHKS